MSTLTIDLADYELLKTARHTAEQEAAKLRVELVAARTANVDDLVKNLMGSFRAGVEVARYAIAHLDGSFARKWPLADLRAVADGIKALPDANAFELELANEFYSFAADVARYDVTRVERYVPPPADSYGIKHAESPDVTPPNIAITPNAG